MCPLYYGAGEHRIEETTDIEETEKPKRFEDYVTTVTTEINEPKEHLSDKKDITGLLLWRKGYNHHKKIAPRNWKSYLLERRQIQVDPLTSIKQHWL